MTKTNPRAKAPAESDLLILVCPSCLTRYTCHPAELAGGAKLCDDCHVPLVQEGRTGSRRRPP